MTTRTDWRFLLPTGTCQHLVLLGGFPAMAESLQEAGVAVRVSEAVEGEKADAVAVLHGADVSPAEAARLLAPGGWLYWETEERLSFRSPLAGPGRAIARLRASGLSVTGVWAVWPDFEHHEAYVPAEALAWFARTVYPSRMFRERVKRSALRLLSGLGPASGALITRFFAITAVDGPVEDAPRPVLLSHGPERVILLSFPPNEVIKLPRLPAFNGKTMREQEMLSQVRRGLQPETARAIPQPRGTVRYGEVVGSVESYAPGRSMILSRGTESDLRLASEWLVRFHLQTIIRREPWTSREIAASFAAWVERIGADPAEATLFDLALAHSRELHGVPFPIVWQHRDFTPWNLLRNGSERLSVLDWEGVQRGPALCDLLHFVGHWDELAAGAVTPEERLRAFVVGDPASRRQIARYCERLDIDPRFVPVLLVYTRVEIALRRPGRTLDARYVSALAGHAEELFRTGEFHHVP